MAVIKTQQIGKSYGTVQALKDLNLEVKENVGFLAGVFFYI